jgi:hypothetical protein
MVPVPVTYLYGYSLISILGIADICWNRGHLPEQSTFKHPGVNKVRHKAIRAIPIG